MKRTPMKPRKVPMLRTGIRRGKPSESGAGLRTGKPLKAVSSKRRRVNAVRRKLAADHLDEPCRLKTPVCTGWAEHWHELVGRAQGGSLVDRRNLSPACDRCNSHVEDFPALAELRGWKVPARNATRGDRGLVPLVATAYAVAWDDRGGDAA